MSLPNDMTPLEALLALRAAVDAAPLEDDGAAWKDADLLFDALEGELLRIEKARKDAVDAANDWAEASNAGHRLLAMHRLRRALQV